MFGRGMTDAAGGNISVRVRSADGWAMCMTPRYAAHDKLWQLDPTDVLVLGAAGDLRDGTGVPSRDAHVHAAIYRAVPEAGAVVHAHAPHCLVFATAKRSIPARLDAALPFGDVPVVDGGADEARAVAAALAASSERIAGFAAAVLIAGHGIVVAGRDLAHAYDALERIESNARTVLLTPLLAAMNGAVSVPVLQATAPR